MAKAIGASGVLGIAIEDVVGTYKAPTKYIPFNSESFKWTQENYERRPIRNSPGLLGIIAGDGFCEGEVEFDCTADTLVWLLSATRCVVQKEDQSPFYTYTFTPSPSPLPSKSLSVSIKRNEEVFGYTGCCVSNFSLKVDGGILKVSANLIGFNESSQSALVPVWPTSVPFGAGSYKLEIPTGTAVQDSDSFEFTVEDNGEAQNRIKDSVGAAFIKYGESDAMVSVERDFETRTEYDKWRNFESQSLTFTAKNKEQEEIVITVPVTFIDSYDVSLGSVGDLVRAQVSYKCAVDASGKHYEVKVKTKENIQ